MLPLDHAIHEVPLSCRILLSSAVPPGKWKQGQGTPDGANEGMEIAVGDLVVLPKGMSCTWVISVAVDKHYNFE
ncbi:hypothetical protein MLD38_022625 [Melastoma candidum]|uniref:Uncharacterized protein n=1 Tax=Melastoma candidum TaxID=119954 RepID=A0ACB9QMX6_9MYRT|nr:hypothetical protein MLD38_022625 [Melastoma candidum]